MPVERAVTVPHHSKVQIFLRFLKFGLLAWGGPIAQIAMIRQALVEKERWISPEKFNRVLAVYQALPGPEAHELCVYFGTLAGGRWGGFLAGLGFMLPGFLLMLFMTWLYVHVGISSPLLQAVFTGFQLAVLALIVSAVHRLGTHVLVDKTLLFIALGSLVAHFCQISFFIVLPLAGVAYLYWKKNRPWIPYSLAFLLLVICALRFMQQGFQPQEGVAADVAQAAVRQSSPLLIFLSGLKAGLLSFGGAYTAIPFIQQDAVALYGWMSNRQFLDGIALSGILPAPLVIFSTFVGYFGGWWWGAVLITIGMFLPAFVFTLMGHELMERLINHAALHSFLDGITAGVIGLIALTALRLMQPVLENWFALSVFFVALGSLYAFRNLAAPPWIILGGGIISLCSYLLL